MIDADTRQRLQKALNHHRSRASEKDLPAERISAASLLAKTEQDADGNYLCATCGIVVSFDPEDAGQPQKATVGHKFHLSAKDRPHAFSEQTHPGHVLENCCIQCWGCNKADNETVVAPCNAKGRTHTVIKGRARSGSIPSRSFHKPKDYQRKWPKRKVGQ